MERGEHIGLIREAIELMEELMLLEVDPERSARLQSEHGWKSRYLAHLEAGGNFAVAADGWAQHHEHYLVVRHSLDDVGIIVEDELLLWCVTCDTWVEVHDRAGESGGTPGRTIFDIYEEHVMHNITIRRDEGPEERGVAIYGFDIGVDCATCGAERDGGYAIFSGVVSDWFDEVWNG